MRARYELTAAEYGAWCASLFEAEIGALERPPRAYVFDASKITAVDLETLKTVKPGRFVRLRANRCDCPGCAPRRNMRKAHISPVARSSIDKALDAFVAANGSPDSTRHVDRAIDAFAIARAIRYAGLNTPDRKQLGAAQTLAGQP